MIGYDQPALFDFVQEEPEPERIWCPFCASNWGPNLKDWVLDDEKGRHREVEPGRCAQMVKWGVTEPFYDRATETPWRSGWVCQYPRPKGCGGLYELRSR